MMIDDPRTYAIVGEAMEVHNQLGCGFLEAVYQDAFEVEFELRTISYRRNVEILIGYKGRPLKSFYNADFLCFDSVVVELKALEAFHSAHDVQVINYLKATPSSRTSSQFRGLTLRPPKARVHPRVACDRKVIGGSTVASHRFRDRSSGRLR